MDYYLSVLKQYAVFTGRAQRAEFWYFTLFNIIIQFVLMALVFGAAFAELGIVTIIAGIILFVYIFGLILPAIGVTIRRLHDTNHSGWWILINMVPFGGLVLLVFLATDSVPGENQYGPNPKELKSS